MQLDLSQGDLDFQAEVRAFLQAELTPELKAAAAAGMSMPRELNARWHRTLFERGWIAPNWPVEYGGTGWTATQKHLFEEEAAAAGAPRIMPFGIGMVGPVIYTFGTEAQQAQHLPGILNGDVWWCQGYSEPGSGSDLASLKTAAVRDGDEYVVNGQKIWTSYAHEADWIFCLVRTDFDCKPQQGISFLLMDMSTPGIEVRPIVSIDGLHHLNEVYFTDVRVPVANRIGEENRGWTYAKYLLGHERTGIAGVAGSKRAVEELQRLARIEQQGSGACLAEDPDFASRLREVEIRLAGLEMTNLRLLAEISAGNSPGDASSTLKITGTEIQQALQTLLVEAIGYYGLPLQLDQVEGTAAGEPVGPDYALRAVVDYNFGRAASIYGGSNEIQRNVIAKAVLGL
ncbi:MAG: acyl-CoA dehydrogenase family protein [Pseudomonadales bacterium]